MSLVELLLSITMCTVTLGGLVLVSESLRTDQSDYQTRVALRAMQDAATRYRDLHGRWPTGTTTGAVIDAMLAEPSTAPLIQPLRLDTDPAGGFRVLDGYDGPIRYIPPDRSDDARVDFVSAGPDGRIGNLAADNPDLRDEAMDNLYASDLETPTP